MPSSPRGRGGLDRIGRMSSAPPNDLPQPPAAAIAPPPAEAVIAPAAAPGRATGVGITHLLLGVVAVCMLSAHLIRHSRFGRALVGLSGSEDAARMALGNLNNLIALRTKDRPTQDFVVETFGKTAIHTVRVGLSHGSDAHLGDFSSSYSTQLTESFEEMVPADVLGKLPNLQYFASVSGGRIIKGRFPILDPDADTCRAPGKATA